MLSTVDVGDRFARDREPSLDGDVMHTRSRVPVDGTCTFFVKSVFGYGGDR